MDGYLTDEELADEAGRIGVWLRESRNYRRYLSHLIAKGILPPRVAIRDKRTLRISWRFPGYAVLCLAALKELGTYPIPVITSTLEPLLRQWRAEWEAAESARKDEGSIDIVGELGPIVLAIREAGTSKLDALCEKGGMKTKELHSLLRKASEDKKLTEREMAEFLWVLRLARRITNDPRTQALILGAADLLERRIRLSGAES